jgi:hypothetical protein
MDKALYNDIKRFGLEQSSEGFYVPRANVILTPGFEVSHYRQGKLLSKTIDKNKIPDAALNYILNTALAGGSQIATWYVGIFKNNYTPLASDTLGGGFLTSAGEAAASTDYSQASRPEYVEVAATAKSITNAASAATFTILTTFTAYGAFLCSAASGSTGTLFAASLFSVSKAVVATDALAVTYVVNAASA